MSCPLLCVFLLSKHILRLERNAHHGKAFYELTLFICRFPAGHGTDDTQGFIIKFFINSLMQTRPMAPLPFIASGN